MKFIAPFRRVDTARGHKYLDGAGNRVPGATTIIDSLPKDALINWAGNATAEGTLDQWDALAEMPPAQRLSAMKGIRYAAKDKAAKRGTEVHRHAELLAHGKAVQVPDELVGHVEAYARFLDEFAVEAEHVEFAVASYRHGYAGTADLIATVTIDGAKVRLLLDVKTTRSGIYGSVALQLAAYRYADVMLTPDGETPVPVVDGCAAIHVRGDGYSLVPVTASEDVLMTFRYLQQIYEWTQVDRDYVGAAITPPTASTYRLTRIEA